MSKVGVRFVLKNQAEYLAGPFDIVTIEADEALDLGKPMQPGNWPVLVADGSRLAWFGVKGYWHLSRLPDAVGFTVFPWVVDEPVRS